MHRKRSRRAGLWGLVLAGGAACALLQPGVAVGAPQEYVRKATWHETMLASREAMAKAGESRKVAAGLPDFGRSPFTIMAWIRTTRGGTILAKAPAEGPWVRQGKSLFVRGRKLCYDIGWVGCVTSRASVADGKWHHVALVGGKDLRMYVDFSLDTTSRLEAEADPKGCVAKIGQTSTNFPVPSDFAGEIDEVRVYSRALSAGEVREIGGRDTGSRRSPGVQWPVSRPPISKVDKSDAGLMGYWPFDGDALDASGSLNHATEVAGAQFVAGKVGKALRLRGSGRVTVPSPAARSPLDALWRRLGRDFPDAASRCEMAWEREDGIWAGRRRPGDWRDLAGRYARASHRVAGLAKQAATLSAAAGDRAGAGEVRAIYLRSRRTAEALAKLGQHDLAGLRRMIAALARVDARARKHLDRLDALEARAAAWHDGRADPDRLAQWADELARLERAALLADNPLIDFDKLVFVKRHTYNSNHYYTEYINSRWMPGGNLCVLDLKTGTVAELVPELTGGVFERFDVSFDADRIVFAWKCAAQQGYRIYEIDIDPATGRRKGTLRQLTFPQKDEADLVRLYRARAHYHHGTDDMHPCYLPGGEIVFISTRCQYGILCDAPDDFTTTVLYRMDADGKNMRKLTNSSVSEASPAGLLDGRILYTRWEYVDKGAVSVKCLWAMRPDGSGSVEIYGNDISLPPTFIYARPIPDMADKYVFLGTPHYPQNGVGTVIRLDMSHNIRTRDPMTYITPYVDIRAEPGFAFCSSDGLGPGEAARWRNDRGGHGPLFKDPYPLSERFFLVSHKPQGPAWNDPKAYGLYLLDETGKTCPIYRDPEISCWLPLPLRPRRKPKTPTAAIDADLAARGLARCIVSDVYRGLTDVKRGEVRYIRVLEQVPRPWASRRRWGGDGYDQQHVVISKDTHLGLKVQHGVVPVEPDGSAHFLVPAMANIFFQALDADYMAVQTERTYVNYMPGEVRSCVGCHETQKDASVRHGGSAGMAVAALRRAPSLPGPQPGETAGGRPIYYPADVQPVLDKHCVPCHSGPKPKASLDLTGTMTALFSRSYENLIPERRRGPGRRRFELVGPTIGENHPKTGNVHYMPAKSFGSHASVLVAMLSKGKVRLRDPKMAAVAAKLAEVHKLRRLAPAELLRITNWVDTNGQYYGSYWGRRNLQYKTHPNFRPTPTYADALRYTSPIPEDKR